MAAGINSPLIPLVVILGPTSSGKSDLAIRLAKKNNGEIISADSRQVYRGLDIGTGKISKREQKIVPHHLLDVARPGTQFTVAKFKKMADRAIFAIHARGKLPFLVGGSALYIKAVLEGYCIPEVKPDRKLRRELEAQPLSSLLKLLKKFDPSSYARIDKKNPRRVIRALEIIYHTGRPVSPLKMTEEKYDAIVLGIDVPREKLYQRIDARVDARIRHGMVGEERRLLSRGVSKKWLKSLGLEYRAVTEYLLRKKQTPQKKAEMIQTLKYEIHDFARRQMVWWRKEKKIRWISSEKEANEYIKNFLG